MQCKRITAIIRTHKLGDVEARLKGIGVKGMSAFHLLGFGEHFNPFNPDELTPHVKIEIWARGDRVSDIVQAIIDAAHVGAAGDGLVAVSPVDELWRVRTKRLVADDEV